MQNAVIAGTFEAKENKKPHVVVFKYDKNNVFMHYSTDFILRETALHQQHRIINFINEVVHGFYRQFHPVAQHEQA